MSVSRRVARWLGLVAVLAVVGLVASGSRAPAEGDAGKTAKFPQHILLIRHAEKTGEKDDVHLSKQGRERAEALGKLFVASRDRPDPFPRPDFIFAASSTKNSHRPVETVKPLAQQLKLTINDRYESNLPTEPDKNGAKKEGMLELRDELFGSPKYAGTTILVAWRHGAICELAKALRATKVPEKWDDEVYDRVWQISYDDAGNATFRDRPQRLLPGDAEK